MLKLGSSMSLCRKTKMAIVAARERERAKMALFNRKHPETLYTAQADKVVVVHAMGISFVFNGGNVQAFIDPAVRPKIAKVGKVLNLKTKEERLERLTLSTNGGAKLDLTSISPNGSDYTLSVTSKSYGGFKLESCFAELNYGCLKLSYNANGTTIRVDETDSSYVLPVKTEWEGKTFYEFYVVKHYADTTLEDIIKDRSNRIRIPGVKHLILDKADYYEDYYGCPVLKMKVILEGSHIGNIFVKADAPRKKAVAEVLHQVVPGTPIPLS